MRFAFDLASVAKNVRAQAIPEMVAQLWDQTNYIADYRKLAADLTFGVVLRRLGDLSFAEVSSSDFSVEHAPRQARKATSDRLLIEISLDQLLGTLQDGREGEIAAGDFAFVTDERPYTMMMSDSSRRLALEIPKRELVDRFGPIDDLTATIFSAKLPVQRLAANFFVDLAKTIDQVDHVTAERLIAQGLDLLVFSMSQQIGESLQNTTVHRSALLFRLKSFILSRLKDPNLALEEAAAAFNMSPRYVNSLLATQETSFGRFVLEKRLQGCRRDLGNPLYQSSNIIDIAFRWGFNDAAHFSRTFKAQFGLPPREFQRQFQVAATARR